MYSKCVWSLSREDFSQKDNSKFLLHFRTEIPQTLLTTKQLVAFITINIPISHTKNLRIFIRIFMNVSNIISWFILQPTYVLFPERTSLRFDPTNRFFQSHWSFKEKKNNRSATLYETTNWFERYPMNSTEREIKNNQVYQELQNKDRRKLVAWT